MQMQMPGPSTGDLAPPDPAKGVQLKMVSPLLPGVETERCQFFQVPAEGWYINKQDIRYTPGSHHVLLFTTTYTTIPTVNIRNETINTSGVFECKNGAAGDWLIDGVAGGAQKGDAPAAVNGLPEDTAFILKPGTVLIMNTHYLNASPNELQTDARINLYFADRAKVKREAGILFFYNPFIYVPGQQQATAQRSCPVLKDINLVNGQSHMHKRGVSYTANLVDSTGKVMDELYQGGEWEQVVLREYGGTGKLLPAGTSIDYKCGYNNKETRNIIQGLTTRDEMCMFVGLYYPRDPQTEFCALMSDRVSATRFLGGTWTGSGALGGRDTMACITSADSNESLFHCVTSSCAKISKPMSGALGCLASGNFGKCDGKTGPDRSGCLMQGCGEQMAALSQASCD
jgi:hypothetical protein